MSANLQNGYRDLFNRLGFPLTGRAAISQSQLTKAEKRIGVRLPDALRDYYIVAGREPRLNHAFNRLCVPGEWEIEAGKLVFMEENQTVVVWGVTATSRPTQDPWVFQGPVVDGAVDQWFPEHNKCSVFLKFTIHLQAAYGGGMPCTATSLAPARLSEYLRRDWKFFGEVNKMRAYSRNRQAVCVAKWQDFAETKQSWRVFAGALTKEDLNAIATDLKLDWD